MSSIFSKSKKNAASKKGENIDAIYKMRDGRVLVVI